MKTFVGKRFIACIIFSLVATPVVWRSLLNSGTEETVFFTVEKTERVIDSNNADTVRARYLVFTKDETFEDTDDLFYWKFNSSDIYGSLKPGHRYKAKVIGRREPILSWYRNIISVKEVSQSNL